MWQPWSCAMPPEYAARAAPVEEDQGVLGGLGRRPEPRFPVDRPLEGIAARFGARIEPIGAYHAHRAQLALAPDLASLQVQVVAAPLHADLHDAI